ncbi:MAG TPA: DNA internalization-related competence protein ComEC/Rec2 [Moorella mulderi]|nr:DNA internalization-related competence protein ComEC/Rec2 [Moorella mulderi]
MNSFLFQIAAAFALGLMLSFYGHFNPWWFLPGALAFSARACFSLSRPWGRTCLLLAFLSWGMFWGSWDLAYRGTRLYRERDTHLDLVGQVVEEPRAYPKRDVYVLRLAEIRQGAYTRKVGEKIQLVVLRPREKGYPLYGYGDILKIHGQLTAPPGPRNPGDMDYAAYLTRQYIYHQVVVGEPGKIEKLGSSWGNPLQKLASWARSRGMAAIEQGTSPQVAGVLKGVLLGSPQELGEEDREAFKTLGVVHFFAVSGFHVGFVILFFMGLAGLLGCRPRTAVALCICLLVFYAALVGWRPAVTRAVIMASLGLVAYILGERRDFYSALGLAALVILGWRPRSLLDVGFQLSFLGTLGIVYLYPLVDGLLKKLPPWRSYLAVVMGAQLALWPLIGYYFGYLPLLGILGNVVAVGFIGCALVVGLAAFFLSLLWPSLGVVLFASLEPLIKVLLGVLHTLSRIPGILLHLPSISVAQILAYYLVLVAVRELYVRRRELPWQALWSWHRPQMILGICLIFIPLVAFCWPWEGRRLEVVFIDVGQGDAVYLRTPGGKNILVDGGGSPGSDFDVGEKITVPVLRRQGVKRVDLVVSTHADWDHLGGLFAVVKELPVSLVVLPPLWGVQKEDYQPFLRELEARKIPYREVRAGDRIHLDPEVDIQVLHPRHPIEGTRDFNNDNCLVIKVSYGKFSLLLTGDVERAGMADMVRRGVDFNCTVYKVPHHGSPYSWEEEFFKRLTPKAVVFSVGERNIYGHPSPKIIKYWQARGADLYRTDQQGAIIFKTDGQRFWVRTIRPAPKGERAVLPFRCCPGSRNILPGLELY